jgi:hypothetical protein
VGKAKTTGAVGERWGERALGFILLGENTSAKQTAFN